MVSGAVRPPTFSPTTFSWMSRLGEFLRTHVPGAVETRTTLTRQQVVGASGEVVSQERLQHTTSAPSSPHPRQRVLVDGASQSAAVPQGSEQDPPLFGPSARRVMEGWLQRAPLLHGPPPPERPATDPGSSVSIPREVVQEEVRRQVQEALSVQQRHVEELHKENRRLRVEMETRRVTGRVNEGDGRVSQMAPEPIS